MAFPRFQVLSLLAFTHDVLAALAAWCVAYWLRLNLEIPEYYVPGMLKAMALCVPIQALAYQFFGLYRGIWRYASLPDLRRIVFAVSTGALLGPFVLVMLGLMSNVPRSVLLLEPILLVLIMGGNRLAYRSWKEHRLFGAVQTLGAPVLVIGTGDAAVNLVKELTRSPDWRVVGLIDENPLNAGRVLQDVKVAGNIETLAQAARDLAATHAIIALPEATHRERRRIVEQCRAADIKVMTIPSTEDMMSGKVQVSAIRQVELDDLLGRDPGGARQRRTEEPARRPHRADYRRGRLDRLRTDAPDRALRAAPVGTGGKRRVRAYTIEQELRQLAPQLAIDCVIGDVRDAPRMRQGARRIPARGGISMPPPTSMCR